MHSTGKPLQNIPFKALITITTALTAAGIPPALAQNSEPVDEIIVKGELRRSLEDSIAAKRNSDVVSDAIIGSELGDLPDLSVAETLERVTGVTSDRFKGGASELSVRGLGAFLGASFINGREISSGSDGRDVNFGQFPSELINGAIIYKSQQASFIEGGVSGIIELQTLRPLDYGKRRVQVQGLVGYSDYQSRVDDSSDINGRVTASVVDQFETGIGEIGIALGGQIRRDNAPEDIYTSSSTYRPCNSSFAIGGGSNCGFDADDPDTETYFVSNQYIYRAQQTDADRDALMANIQWRPDNNWEVNFDGQWSDRTDIERRHNLVLADGRRRITPIQISSTGALEAWSGQTRIENQSVWRAREEQYLGLGLNVAWANDKFEIVFDAGYSDTERRQDELDMRIRTNDRIEFEFDTRGQTIPVWTFTDVSDVEDDTGLTFDLNNHDLYTNGARARRRLENVDDEILSFRMDSAYNFDDSALRSIEFGLRYADRHRVRDDGIDTTLSDLVDGGYASDAVIATRRDNFPVEDLFVGANTPVEGITWATWEPEALFVALTGSRDAGLPTGSTLSTNDADITEKTYAAYIQANYETTLFDIPARGNIGLRAVYTEIDSLGISANLATVPDPDDANTLIITEVGDPIANVESNDFWNFLPSANLILETAPETLLRFAIYRAIARPDPEAMSAALDFDDEADLGAIGEIVTASGNPFLEPLESLNFDISYEWYPADETTLAVALYAKRLRTGFETDVQTITLNVDGQPTDLVIGRTVNSDESSRLLGLEVTAKHVFTNLPGIWSGLGVSAGYNFADSNFEFPDPRVISGLALADFTEPANIPGYSRHSGNITGFWEYAGASLRVAYKIRSSYFKPFRSDANRFTETQGFLDFSASYDVTDNVELRVQGLNLLDEPNIFNRPTGDSLAQADYSGRRFFAGARIRF